MIYVFYHSPCPDGFGAAFAAYKYFSSRKGSAVEFVPLAYGEPLPVKPENDRLFFLDVTVSTETFRELLANGCTVTVIDHHQTAFENLKELKGEPQLYLILNNDKSGTVLAWEYFNWHDDVPEMLLYIQDRDLWNWELPYSREINAAISSYPFDFEIWEDLLTMGVPTLRHQGEHIIRYHNQAVSGLLESAHWGMMGGDDVIMINCASRHLISDVGNRLLELYPETPYAAVYRYYINEVGELECGWSLRSRGDVNVAEVARKFGGGGHVAASGFREQISGSTELRYSLAT